MTKADLKKRGFKKGGYVKKKDSEGKYKYFQITGFPDEPWRIRKNLLEIWNGSFVQTVTAEEVEPSSFLEITRVIDNLREQLTVE